MNKHIFYLSVIAILIIAVGYFAMDKKGQPAGPTSSPSQTDSLPYTNSLSPELTPEDIGQTGLKTYHFNNFHGENVFGGGFEFQYPANWYNNSQYFSPQKIKYYDIVSVDAPVYYDLVSKDLFDTSDIKYQLTNDKRNKPDTNIKIDGKNFMKYDLFDYNGEGNSDRVIIYLGPQISFNGDSYYLAFRWEERPLAIDVPGNDPTTFEKIVGSLKFTK